MPYFDNFVPGQKITTPTRTIFLHDITAFAGMSGDWHPLHSDVEFAKQSIYGSVIAHGPLVLVVAYGLMVRAGLFEAPALAFLGLSFKMKAAVYPGDTIHTEVRVVDVRRSRSKPDRGVVILDFVVLNQRSDEVASGTWTNMYATNDPEETS